MVKCFLYNKGANTLLNAIPSLPIHYVNNRLKGLLQHRFSGLIILILTSCKFYSIRYFKIFIRYISNILQLYRLCGYEKFTLYYRSYTGYQLAARGLCLPRWR